MINEYQYFIMQLNLKDLFFIAVNDSPVMKKIAWENIV